MTCIIGLVDNGKIYIGGDSAASSGWNTRTTAVAKVFRFGEFLIGCTGSIRALELLQFHLQVTARSEDENDDLRYMVTVFAEAVRQCLKEHGCAKVENNQEQSDSEFLVGYRGKLFSIQANFQVCAFTDAFDAIGVGGEYALGALMALKNLSPIERIQAALEIAAYFSNGVRAPFHILEQLSR